MTLATASAVISADEAQSIAAELYGLRGNIERIAGERDDNFSLVAPDGAVMVKVIHAAEDQMVTDCQNSVLMHLSDVAPEIPCARIIPALDGSLSPRISFGAARGRSVRVVTRLPGEMMNAVEPSRLLRRRVGQALAGVDRALARFSHPGATRETLWNLTRQGRLWPLVEELPASALRDLLSARIDDFETRVEPRLIGLRKQAIHNDFSGDNVLVDRETVTGVLDFGDMTQSYLACDVATAAVVHLGEDNELFTGAVDFVRGYQDVIALTADEIELLFDLMLARMTTRLVIPHWRAIHVPQNRDYALRHARRVERQLRALEQQPPQLFRDLILRG